MNKKEKALWYLLGATVAILIVSIYTVPKSTYANLYQPKDLCFVMYTEVCPRCAYDKVESEYSIVSNYGSSSCRKCNSHIEFTLDKKGNKVICNEEY